MSEKATRRSRAKGDFRSHNQTHTQEKELPMKTIRTTFIALMMLAVHAGAADITLAQAEAAVAAAKVKAAELNTKMDICIVDAGANLKAFARMDGAWLGSIDISIKKAKTARFFDMNTGEIGKLSKENGPLFNIEHSNGGLITFPGGIPIRNAAGVIIGAIGVSGDSVENDHLVAAAGAAAVK